MTQSKRQKEIAKLVDVKKVYALPEAVETLKKCPDCKFDESVEMALNLNVDPKHADQQVRGTVILPHGTGKNVRVAVFAKGDAATAAEKAGADIVGADDLAKRIEGGFLDFDRVIATPDTMPIVGKLGKILGPKGLMPNPKLGTVSTNPAKVVKDVKSGMIEFRVEKTGIIQVAVGKKSFTAKNIQENAKALVEAVRAAKPSGIKGLYIKRLAVSTTMGPGLKVDLTSV